jgi:hypothetical protein
MTIKHDTQDKITMLFNILARYGVDRVVVYFHGGSDVISFIKDYEEIDLEEDEAKTVTEEDYEVLFGSNKLIRVWHDFAHYTRYESDDSDEGEVVGVDDGQVIFDVAKREIRLEARAEWSVVEHRCDEVSRVWRVHTYSIDELV